MKSKQSLRLDGRVIRMAMASILAVGCASALNSHAAGSQSTTLAVSATVAPNCTISTLPLDFGAYDPIVTNASAPRDASGTVRVACTSGATTTVTLDTGLNPSGGLRRMKAGASNYLNYSLFSDPGYAIAWGTGTDAVGHTGTGTQTDLLVYGRITQGQNVPAGSYADTVTAVVNF